MARYLFDAVTPVELELGDAPPEVRAELIEVIRAVFAGEYDAPYFGHGLTVLDVGANVGAFARWAHLRWPSSTISAYEPDPQAFDLLTRNVRGLPGIRCVNAAVAPVEQSSAPFVRRAGGDVEAALVAFASEFLTDIPSEQTIQVDVVHPRSLPAADIVKVDAEGAELAILSHLDLSQVSLIMVEYHDLDRRHELERLTAGSFAIERRTAYPWAPYLRGPRYKSRPAHDEYGVLVLVNRHFQRLHRADDDRIAVHSGPTSLRQACLPLPRLVAAALRRRASVVRARVVGARR